MSDQPFTSDALPEVLYRSLFEAMPSNSILLKNDAPKHTIIAATAQYLKDTNSTKETLLGKGVLKPSLPTPRIPVTREKKTCLLL